jgi:hypothetical protein
MPDIHCVSLNKETSESSMMLAYETYTLKLEKLVSEAIKLPSETLISERIVAALDGEPSQELRRAINAQNRREVGAYFTGSNLANKLSVSLPDDKLLLSVFFDPACGAGDLLIAASDRLPVFEELGETLALWGQHLKGFDLHDEFIRATKARLILAAIARGARVGQVPIPFGDDLFPFIQVGDGRTHHEYYSTVTCIFINPPFFITASPERCNWAGGKVSAAAIFIDMCVTHAKPGTKIIAILPDVLRSGSFYQHWREHVASKALVESAKPLGQFDQWTEVDVFALELTISPCEDGEIRSHEWWRIEGEDFKEKTVGGFFYISVGQVVPHRDAEEGMEYPYIHPKNLPVWRKVKHLTERRRFSKKVVKPPFVAVRRTSRSDDKYRAVGTIVTGKEPVAVENHLMVLKPKDGRLRTCARLIDVLKSKQTNDWLNQRIRCRHLTVPALEDLPWWSAE